LTHGVGGFAEEGHLTTGADFDSQLDLRVLLFDPDYDRFGPVFERQTAVFDVDLSIFVTFLEVGSRGLDGGLEWEGAFEGGGELGGWLGALRRGAKQEATG
jgi:hypothetical protein